ncbi:gamma carbonic anhydrase family protein [Saccharospirillum salsuginis]|uniref:Gamma carbonic anhydrase family protein n=1 Tax=Saccharospirillum salsuginis TaxID=418750 RepID=A0A918K9T9_9GAMM|nr:gamma carbonic anhydrase family protein [Saccharospirillum salsuginis]GGX56279.1 gamma carbonic anhydrase family protein [Saccharospirillum salsuginis]
MIIEPWNDITPTIDASAFVATGAAVVGDVTLGPDSSVWYGSVLRGDDHWIRVGAGSNIQDGTVIHVSLDTHPTRIGDRVTVGHGARLHGCTIGDESLVGIGAIVLDGAELEPGSMLAAGAMLTPGKRVPSGELWAGSPARKLRDLTQADLDFIRWDAEHYIKLARRYRNR